MAEVAWANFTYDEWAALTIEQWSTMTINPWFNDQISLLITGDGGQRNVSTTLIINGHDPGSLGGLSQSCTLYINAADFHDNIFLFIQNDESSLDNTGNISLYLNGAYESQTAYCPIFLQQDGIYESLELVIEGTGIEENALPYNESITLFINRPDEVTVIPLFLKAIDTTSTKYITSYIKGGVSVTENITLVYPNIVGSSTKNIVLYTHGFPS